MNKYAFYVLCVVMSVGFFGYVGSHVEHWDEPMEYVSAAGAFCGRGLLLLACVAAMAVVVYLFSGEWSVSLWRRLRLARQARRVAAVRLAAREDKEERRYRELTDAWDRLAGKRRR